LEILLLILYPSSEPFLRIRISKSGESSFNLSQATKDLRENRGIALLFFKTSTLEEGEVKLIYISSRYGGHVLMKIIFNLNQFIRSSPR
jgi:hypothetical protein